MIGVICIEYKTLFKYVYVLFQFLIFFKFGRIKLVKWKILIRVKLIKENEYKYEFVINRN